jgi:hypothetical protein
MSTIREILKFATWAFSPITCSHGIEIIPRRDLLNVNIDGHKELPNIARQFCSNNCGNVCRLDEAIRQLQGERNKYVR